MHGVCIAGYTDVIALHSISGEFRGANGAVPLQTLLAVIRFSDLAIDGLSYWAWCCITSL